MMDTEKAIEALYSIPPDLPREEWVRAGMAAHASGIDFDTFDQWSAQASTYDARAARDTWRSFKEGKGIGGGTLYRMAAEHGWRMDGKSRQGPQRAHGRSAATPARVRPGLDAAAVWNRCEPASESHPYIQSKQGSPDGLRVIPEGDPLRIAGESMAGALVIPVLRADGSVSSLQCIAAPDIAARLKASGRPGKLNLPGAGMDGWFTVGELRQGGTAYLCEGIGQAWACWKATGAASVVCFGWGRVRSVAQVLRERDAGARLVLVPDVGKEADAEAIARESGALVASLPDGWPNNSDANDYAQREGHDALEVLLSQASAPPTPEPRFRLLTGDDLRDLPPLSWRIRGVLPAQGLAAVYGPSGSGKTFLALDMACATAEGRAWFGCRSFAAPIVYAALEGEAGLKLRAQAWEAHTGRKLPAGMHLLLQPFKLTEPQDIADLAKVVPSGAVVFLDTLNRAAPTADENSSRDMGEILENAKQLQSKTGGLVILVHHTGKDASKGLRGHSSLFAALDAAVEVSRDGDRREWRIAKSKDGQDGDARPFKLQTETLGIDAHGDPVTSCVVVPDTTAKDVQRVRLPQGGNQRLVFDALRPLFKDGEAGKPGAPPLARSIELEAAIAAGAAKLSCPPDKRNSRTREAITGLVSRGVLGLHEGWLWQC